MSKRGSFIRRTTIKKKIAIPKNRGNFRLPRKGEIRKGKSSPPQEPRGEMGPLVKAVLVGGGGGGGGGTGLGGIYRRKKKTSEKDVPAKLIPKKKEGPKSNP